MRFLNLLTILAFTALLLTAGCFQQKEEPSATHECRDIFHVFSFDGAMGNRYLMHFGGPDSPATLFTHDETLVLAHQPAASGAKYLGERIMVWLKGDEVLMEVDGQRVGPCKVSNLQSILTKAWRSGTDFWAVGNEPSWNLVMGRERVILLTELGQKSMEFPGLGKEIFDPRNPNGHYSFLNDENHELKIEILPGLCTDTMSGEPFVASVKLVLDGKEMSGCGTGLF